MPEGRAEIATELSVSRDVPDHCQFSRPRWRPRSGVVSTARPARRTAQRGDHGDSHQLREHFSSEFQPVQPIGLSDLSSWHGVQEEFELAKPKTQVLIIRWSQHNWNRCTFLRREWCTRVDGDTGVRHRERRKCQQRQRSDSFHTNRSTNWFQEDATIGVGCPPPNPEAAGVSHNNQRALTCT